MGARSEVGSRQGVLTPTLGNLQKRRILLGPVWRSLNLLCQSPQRSLRIVGNFEVNDLLLRFLPHMSASLTNATSIKRSFRTDLVDPLFAVLAAPRAGYPAGHNWPSQAPLSPLLPGASDPCLVGRKPSDLVGQFFGIWGPPVL